jgi:hypothetical protein
MDTIEALKLIIARSPRAAEHAVIAIQAARNKSPILQARYAQVLTMALADPAAEFTADERAVLAAGIDGGDAGGRDFTLRVRLTEQERVSLSDAADAEGISLSEYVRRRLFGE